MTINIPTPLRTYTAGAATVPVEAGTVSAALEALVTAHPGLRTNLFAADGKLRSFVNLYLNEDDIRYLPMKEDSPTSPSDELTIIPSIAGGAPVPCAKLMYSRCSDDRLGCGTPSVNKLINLVDSISSPSASRRRRARRWKGSPILS